jgi:pimeloyl-ACP methyl ester carboxylesterase
MLAGIGLAAVAYLVFHLDWLAVVLIVVNCGQRAAALGGDACRQRQPTGPTSVGPVTTHPGTVGSSPSTALAAGRFGRDHRGVSVLIVPGAGVSRYARPAVEALRGRGMEAELLAAPGASGGAADLRRYGEELADRIRARGQVELVMGLSVGAQVAAVAAALAVPQVRRLVLVSPTVDPEVRTGPRLLARWLVAGRLEHPGLLAAQAPDWRAAGARRLVRVVRSALRVRIEDVLGEVEAELTVVHGDRDVLTSHGYAAALAADHGGRLLVVPGATHSWPYADGDRFARIVADLLR